MNKANDFGLRQGKLTTDAVLAALEKNDTGKKVLAFLKGEKVDDAVSGGRLDMLQVTPSSITLKLPFATVSMTYQDRAKSWDLWCKGATERTNRVNGAFIKVIVSAWHVGIRGVIM